MNKLTPEQIEAQIKEEQFMKMGKKTTVCLLTLNNGYELVGTSGCVDPDNYDAEIGQRIARENAVDQIWMLEGYVLQNKLASK